MKRSVILATATLAVSLFALPMFATTVPSVNTNNVTANVVGSCKWITPLTMAFGSYDPFAAVSTTTTSVNFKCVKLTTVGDTYKVWFSKSGGNMLNGALTLAYTLTDSTGTTALPITAGTAVLVVGVPGLAGAGYSYTVKGSITAGQDATVGAYSDTVTSNIEY